MIHRLLIEYDDEKRHTNIELPESAIVCAGLVALAQEASLYQKIRPLIVSRITLNTLMPHQVHGGKA